MEQEHDEQEVERQKEDLERQVEKEPLATLLEKARERGRLPRTRTTWHHDGGAGEGDDGHDDRCLPFPPQED